MQTQNFQKWHQIQVKNKRQYPIYHYNIFIDSFQSIKLKKSAKNIFVLTFRYIRTWQKSQPVVVLTIKNTPSSNPDGGLRRCTYSFLLEER